MHRDVKADNVMLLHASGLSWRQLQCKLIDFGFAAKFFGQNNYWIVFFDEFDREVLSG